MLFEVVSLLSDVLAKTYGKSRAAGVALAVALVGAVASVGLAVALGELDAGADAPPTVQEQLRDLEEVSRNLSELGAFVERQKQSVQDDQQALELMQQERESLRPLLETEREVVEAMFTVQERRQRESRWINLGLGFGIGVLSSIVASVIMGFVRKVRSKEDPQSAEPAAAGRPKA